MKTILLLGAAVAATPALAQDMGAPPAAQAPTTPPTDQTAPPQTTPPTTETSPPQTAPSADAAAPAPAFSADGEFATYDKNADGSLSRSEFGSWVSAHNAAAASADPAAKKMSAGSAFAKADADKSKSVSKDELASFLAPPQS